MTLGAALILALVGLGCLAAGILVGRYYVPDDRMLRRTARHGRSYARATSLVLEGDRDAAIAELKQVVAENIDDIEPYFALGALFRGRGDWERAIRIHQAIAAREPRSKQLHLRAQYALGLDFCRAGMPRRAIRAMEQCLALDSKHEGALQALCGLYEEQGRYQEAAEMWRRLQAQRVRGDQAAGQGEEGEAMQREHHLLVAAAQRALYAGDADRARRLLRDAKRSDDRSVHYLAASAELAAHNGDAVAASELLVDAVRAAPELAAFLIPGLLEAERQRVLAEHKTGRRGARRKSDGPDDDDAQDERALLAMAARRVVDALVSAIPAADEREPRLQLALAELRSHYEPAAALADYRRLADAFPGLLPARIAAARLALAHGEPAGIQAELEALAAAGGTLSWATEGRWRCGQCGHGQDDFFWRCSACRSWGTVRLDLGGESPDLQGVAASWHMPRLPRGGVDLALRNMELAERALPAPTIAPMAQAERAPGMLRRMSAWFTSARSPAERVEHSVRPAGHSATPAPVSPATANASRAAEVDSDATRPSQPEANALPEEASAESSAAPPSRQFPSSE